MTHERVIEGLYEARWQPGVEPEFHRAEYKQNRHVEEKNVPERINNINMVFFNMITPVVAVVEAEKPNSENSDKGSIFLDIIEMIFEAIGKMAKAILPNGKEA
jgi:hypothetical protein